MTKRKGAVPDHYTKGYRLADHAVGTRVCLGCGKPFVSLGPGNRVCAPCQKKQITTGRNTP